MTLSFGAIVILALVMAVIVIGAKVKNNTKKLQELEELMGDR